MIFPPGYCERRNIKLKPPTGRFETRGKKPHGRTRFKTRGKKATWSNNCFLEEHVLNHEVFKHCVLLVFTQPHVFSHEFYEQFVLWPLGLSSTCNFFLSGWEDNFTWHEYLKETKSTVAPMALFGAANRDEVKHGFREGNLL